MADNKNNMRKVKIAPSILSADFAHLAEAIASIEQAGADLIHLDIMDGHFVPNISFGPSVVAAIRKITKLPLDVHLMISDPAFYIPRFVESGADYLTVHLESGPHLHRNIQSIKKLNIKAGVSLNPHSSIVLITEILADIDLLLLMSVNPGFGGQRFIERTLEKIRIARRLMESGPYHFEIEVDGGINDTTGKQCREAGADILVAGEYIFRSSDIAAAVASLRV
jgi:ribulose-phosphate 3-epimerase